MKSLVHSYLTWTEKLSLPWALLLALMLLAGLMGASLIRRIKLPSIVGTLLCGVLLGPSLLRLVPMSVVPHFGFITDMALALVALNLGLEFNLETIRRLGVGMVVLILFESLLTFLVIGAGVFLLTKNMILALVAGAVGSASAPTGPVAVAQEKHARGPLTSTIFAVVGFDDAVGILIFSFAHAIARHLLVLQTPGISDALTSLDLLLHPLREIGLSFLLGGLAGLVYWLIIRRGRDLNSVFLWLLALVFLLLGLSNFFHFSTILANMMLGMLVVNTSDNVVASRIQHSLAHYMPLAFILFFVFTGVQLDLRLLPSIGMFGLVFLLCRGMGKFVGSFFGASLGRLDKIYRSRIWMGLLSQIGVGTGLTLIIIDDFSEISEAGRQMGLTVLAVVTVTSLVFELVGPWLTQLALTRSGEIPQEIPQGGAEESRLVQEEES